MHDSSKSQRTGGATPIKNPLLSASVTGLTFDDFPNKPQLLPAAPPIVHAPPPQSVTPSPSLLLGREHKSLVTVGTRSSLDTENLDEINLNASNEDSVSSGTSDANANPLLEQPNTSDSILSQAASSFSALPSVASNVFSSFSKRINAISSRETTPSYDQDTNANFGGVPQLDIQPTYTQHQHYQLPAGQVQQPIAEPFYATAAVPPPPQAGQFFGSITPATAGLEATQSNLPPAEPPKFYTPGEVPKLNSAPSIPPPNAGGQNSFRFTAKKKLYAPIPGLGDQNQPTASTFQPSAVNAPIAYDSAYTPNHPYAQPAQLNEERKTGGGLFSKISNLAPTGVLQNITGLVQSAAGTLTQTIKSDSTPQNPDQQNQQYFGVSFDQPQSGYFGTAPLPPPPTNNYFVPTALVEQQQANYPPPPPATNEFPQSALHQVAPIAAASFFNPQVNSQPIAPAFVAPTNLPSTASTTQVNFFDPSKAPAVFDPFNQPSNTSEPERPPRPPSHPYNCFSEIPTFVTPSGISQQILLPPSYTSRPPSQSGSFVAQSQLSTNPPPISFFNPLQATSEQALQTSATPTSSPQVALFDPTKYLPSNTTLPLTSAQPPSQSHLPPTTGSSLPPPPAGQTSYRLQKGTKLYKNPLTAQETAPVQVTPNPTVTAPQTGFAPTGFAPNTNIVAQATPSTIYNPFGQGFNPSTVPPVSNIFVPSAEPQSVSLFAPPSTEAIKVEELNSKESIQPSIQQTTQITHISDSNQSVPLFAAPIEETKAPHEALLTTAAREEIKSETPISTVASDSIPTNNSQLANSNQTFDSANIQPVENTQNSFGEKQPLTAEATHSAYLFKPIDPVAAEATQPAGLLNFFGNNEESKSSNIIEPVVEHLELVQPQPATVADPLEQTLQNLSLSEKSITPAVEAQVVSQPPPPSTQADLGLSNPYRRGSVSETTKPSVSQPTLANFFTPAASSGPGEFNFFSSLSVADNNINQQSATNFFSAPPQQIETLHQSADPHNFFSSTASEVKNQTTSFFAPPISSENRPAISNTTPVEVTPSPQPSESLIANQAANFFAAPDQQQQDILAITATKALLQEPLAIVSPISYPTDISTQHSTATFPPLPGNIDIIPTVLETFENINKHPAEATLSTHVLPPIGFENFIQNPSTNQAPEKLNPTESSIQKTQNEAAHSFSNFFNNQIQIGQPEVCKDPSSFFDSFAGQPPQPTLKQQPTPSGNSQAPIEDQRIQNFFNNPPPKDAYHVGDLNYDLVHSGLAIKNLQQRSLTPISNLVEPPSSACSEFSTITASETSIVKESNKLEESLSLAGDANIKHYEELPEEILNELRMANLLQSDKAATTPPAGVSYKPAVKHWFYKHTVDAKQIWTPFSHYDSALLETSLEMEGEDKADVVAVEGGRYDVTITERRKRSVYWDSEPIEVRRCSWFYKAIDSKYIPYEEATADLLEAEYKQAAESGVWHKTIILGMGEQVVFHGPTVIVHFQQQQNQDAWGGTVQTTSSRPRVVKRDLDDFHIMQGESQKVDHLLFMVHGIGSACDLKLRSVEEVVEDFRSIAHQLVLSHYKNSADLGLVGRVEVLPISWHSHLHSNDLGIDEKLRSITLESIPKLRNFTNDTLLDILFYTSPTFCQRIMNSIVLSLNDIYLKYRQRHPDFNGGVSLAGHSLGSLILFDLLCHQNPIKECEEKNLENPDQQFMTTPDTMQSAQTQAENNQTESKQISYTMGPAGTGQPFISYGQLIFQPKKFFALGSPIGMFVTIRGIDKLGVDFRLPTCAGFYNIFHPYDPVAYRIEALVNPDLSTVRPVLIPHHKGRKRMHLELKETMARVSMDLKQRFLDKFKNTFDSVNIFGTTTKSKKEAEELMEKEVEKVIEMQMQLERDGGRDNNQQSQTPSNEHLSPSSDEHAQPSTTTQALRSRTDSVSTVLSDDMVEIDLPLGKLNDSKRIDYVLQEAPLEFINEYIFALSSHVCYWDSSDTILFVMKEIYSGLGISPDSQVPQQTMTIERPSSRNSLSTS